MSGASLDNPASCYVWQDEQPLLTAVSSDVPASHIWGQFLGGSCGWHAGEPSLGLLGDAAAAELATCSPFVQPSPVPRAPASGDHPLLPQLLQLPQQHVPAVQALALEPHAAQLVHVGKPEGEVDQP